MTAGLTDFPPSNSLKLRDLQLQTGIFNPSHIVQKDHNIFRNEREVH